MSSAVAPTERNSSLPSLKVMLREGDPAFLQVLRAATLDARSFSEVLALQTLRKRALQLGRWSGGLNVLRLAVVGGSSLRPLADLIEHFTSVLLGAQVKLWLGDFDNYLSEITTEDSGLYAFAPELVFLLPSERRCRYMGALGEPLSAQQAEADRLVADLLSLTDQVHQRCGAEIILANFRLPPDFNPGPMRCSSLASDYAFRKYVNLQLGLKLPSHVHLCDVEFLANRIGTLRSVDMRTWFESKQPFSSELMVEVAREFAVLIASLKQATKKVIVLDLDNTLWGGVIGDDGLEGIEIGTTSPRGEAYRNFQQSLLELSRRGFLLAVCSKNDHDKAIEPFLKHPEMVLRLSDIVNFKANWEPKPDNIREIALELSVGLDSLVFLDDSPAEIEIVRQFVPEVTGLWLGEDPSTYSATLNNSRLFEMRSVTTEDLERVKLYRREAARQELRSTSTDLRSYLDSLQMKADPSEFTSVDVPRITQLINKSNQFNLTTRRRTEVEVQALSSNQQYPSFTVRLSDRYGDQGLIAVVITRLAGMNLVIDTWLMSCRVLKREVEEFTLNHIVQLAQQNGCSRLLGTYLPTAKNGMVADLYPRMGFTPVSSSEEQTTYSLDVATYVAKETQIMSTEKIHATA